MSFKKVVKKITNYAYLSGIEYDDYRECINVSFDDPKQAQQLADYVINHFRVLNKYFSDIDCNIDAGENVEFKFWVKEKQAEKIARAFWG